MSFPLVIFQHLPKTGGTTLADILVRNIPSERRIDLTPGPVASALGTYPLDYVRGVVEARSPEALEQLRMIGGHVGFGVHTCFDRPAIYLSLIRDPVDRLISAFCYSIPDGRLPSGEPVTLEDYAFRTRHYDLGLSNHQVRAVSGVPDLDPVGPFTTANTRPMREDDLEHALNNLDRYYQLLGVTDRFDEFLVVLCQQLGWRLSDAVYVPRNVTTGRPSLAEVPQAVIAELERQNTFDRQLYEFASARLSKMIEAMGSSFTPKLGRFRALNEAHQRGVPISELELQ
jgi:hypothetical protein